MKKKYGMFRYFVKWVLCINHVVEKPISSRCKSSFKLKLLLFPVSLSSSPC
ncbi:hypothetical protein SOVF_033130 [Spinacia oleracea]|nr:hypothetical protein SOVF_033130 [Spinacia oleracea]